ncbi:MAG TPA: LysR family transcriptional regulator [Gammaproteobacteria bacterium]|nr:LysR family transcriptional regulator [Gammaproteobacteria bacterium]
MDLRCLKYFTAVYEAGSLTAASKILYISQPSISLALEKLEAKLQTKLFVRGKQGVIPTDDGNRLYPSAKHLLEQASGIKTFFTSSKYKHLIKINVTRSIRISLIARILKTVISELPDLELRINDKQSDADIRFTSNHLVTEEELFVPLWEENLVAALPRDNVLQVKKKLNLDELLEYPLIERTNCEFHSQMMKLITQKDGGVSVAAKVDSEEWAVALVESGIGVAIVPESSIWGNNTIASCEISGEAILRHVGIAYAKGSTNRPEINNIIQACKNGFKQILASNKLIQRDFQKVHDFLHSQKSRPF